VLTGKIKLEDYGNVQEWIQQYASSCEKNSYGFQPSGCARTLIAY